MNTYEKILADFKKRGIPTELPDFYDHPSFIAAEQQNPSYLNNYAFYVASRPYSTEYLARARETITITSKILFDQLKQNGRQGACVDITGMLARILERHGVWCVCIKGSCTIEFPAESQEETTYFHSVDHGNFAAGHAWLYAPPFDIVDLTIRHQAYSGNKKHFIPDFIIAESLNNAVTNVADIISPTVMFNLRMQGVSEKNQLNFTVKDLSVIQQYFPAKLVDGLHGTRIKYSPVAIHASVESLEGMDNMSFNGDTPFKMYQKHIKNSIQSKT